MKVQKSTVVFRCAAPGCTAKKSVEFETMSDVVDSDGSWILPPKWGEEEVRVDEKEVYYILCPRHTVVLTPEFVEAPEQASDWRVEK